jgi:hypothetical protein
MERPMTEETFIWLVTSDGKLLANYLREVIAPDQNNAINRKLILEIADILEKKTLGRQLHLEKEPTPAMDLILRRLGIEQEVEEMCRRQAEAGQKVVRKVAVGEVARRRGLSDKAVRDALRLASKASNGKGK